MDSVILSNFRDLLPDSLSQTIPVLLTSLQTTSKPVLLLGTVAAAGVTVAVYVASIFARNYFQAWTSPMHILPGPQRESLMLGSFVSAHEADGHRLLESWIEKYGRAIRYYSVFGVRRYSLSYEANMGLTFGLFRRRKRWSRLTPRRSIMFSRTAIYTRNQIRFVTIWALYLVRVSSS